MEFTFLSTKELIEILSTRCQSFVLIYNVYDEDCSENLVKTNKISHQIHRMQALGLASKLQYWLEEKLKPNSKIDKDNNGNDFNNDNDDNDNDDNDNDDNENDDNEVSEMVGIITELKNRSVGLAIGVLKFDSTFFMFQSDEARGQSLGLAIELHNWIRENEK